jgi:hypothetical protein
VENIVNTFATWANFYITIVIYIVLNICDCGQTIITIIYEMGFHTKTKLEYTGERPATHAFTNWLLWNNIFINIWKAPTSWAQTHRKSLRLGHPHRKSLLLGHTHSKSLLLGHIYTSPYVLGTQKVPTSWARCHPTSWMKALLLEQMGPTSWMPVLLLGHNLYKSLRLGHIHRSPYFLGRYWWVLLLGQTI